MTTATDRFIEVTPERLVEMREMAKATFLPSSPVTTQELLFGRDNQLRRTLDTLEIPGRSVFIYGERGVGKTSLAKTASYLFHACDSDPVYVPGTATSGSAATSARRRYPARSSRSRSRA